MNLAWNGRERIAASRERVWAFITDPDKVAHCMPDLVEATVHTPRSFDAVVSVGVGPVRGKFTLKVALDPRPDGGHIAMTVRGGGLGSVVDLIAEADLSDDGDATTNLDWQGTATMRGPIATVGGRVIDAQAKRVIGTTFANVRLHVTEAA